MGADSFIAFHDIKIAIDLSDAQVRDALESHSDPRCKAAKRAGLHMHWGRLTDGKYYFLYIVHRLGWLGAENDGHVQVPTDKLTETMTRVQSKLKEVGFDQSPAFHLQLGAQY
jgi:hypothetical protein